MHDEMDSLKKNKTWEMVDRPPKTRIAGSKWIFTRKEGILGLEPPKLKARLVARGIKQKEGIDFIKYYLLW
ncbi:unnamed protein product [Rhodiola kirilowii]